MHDLAYVSLRVDDLEISIAVLYEYLRIESECSLVRLAFTITAATAVHAGAYLAFRNSALTAVVYRV